jgi:centromere DNA-binding complex CBF3 subunit-like protein
MVLRGESRRMAQVPDLVIDLPNEDLLLIMRNGKTNQHHKVEYRGALRNKEILLCPLSARGFYFFWHSPRAAPPQPVQPFRQLPSFHGPNDYYDRGRSNTRRQRDWTKKLFVSAGIQSSKKTYTTRKQAARHTEVEMERVDAGGPATPCRAYTSLRYRENSCARWPAPRMKREASSSGGPRWNPPRQVWSEVGEWLDKMEAFQPGSRRNQVERMDLVGMDLVGSGFQRLLRVLRTVVLQDSAILRPLFPDAPARPTRPLLPGSRLPPRPRKSRRTSKSRRSCPSFTTGCG